MNPATQLLVAVIWHVSVVVFNVPPFAHVAVATQVALPESQVYPAEQLKVAVEVHKSFAESYVPPIVQEGTFTQTPPLSVYPDGHDDEDD